MATEKQINNPPAFPTIGYDIPSDATQGMPVSVTDKPGMTLRDYFAAKAPEAPEWFEIEAPKQPNTFAQLSAKIQKKYDSESDKWIKRPTKHEREFMIQWAKDWIEYFEKENEYQTKRFFAWRFYYADAMLKARQNPIQ